MHGKVFSIVNRNNSADLISFLTPKMFWYLFLTVIILILLFVVCVTIAVRLTAVPPPMDLVNRNRFIRFDILRMLGEKPQVYLLRKVSPRLAIKWERFVIHIWQVCLLSTPQQRHVSKRKTKFNGVKVNIYTPRRELISKGAVIFFHGGGFCIFSADLYDRFTSDIALRCGVTVISVDYRLAPEHPYPTPLADCEAATVHLLQEAYKELNIDPEKVVLMGDSAGGNLAVVVGMRLRQQSTLPQIKAHVLLYPCLQMVDLNTPGLQVTAKAFRGSMILNDTLLKMWLEQYLKAESQSAKDDSQLASFIRHDLLPTEFVEVSDYNGSTFPNGKFKSGQLDVDDIRFDPNVSPLFADDEILKDTPETLIQTVQHDLIRDDGFWYVKRLRDNNVTVAHKHYDSYFHAIIPIMCDVDAANILQQDIANFVKDHIN